MPAVSGVEAPTGSFWMQYLGCTVINGHWLSALRALSCNSCNSYISWGLFSFRIPAIPCNSYICLTSSSFLVFFLLPLCSPDASSLPPLLSQTLLHLVAPLNTFQSNSVIYAHFMSLFSSVWFAAPPKHGQFSMSVGPPICIYTVYKYVYIYIIYIHEHIQIHVHVHVTCTWCMPIWGQSSAKLRDGFRRLSPAPALEPSIFFLVTG